MLSDEKKNLIYTLAIAGNHNELNYLFNETDGSEFEDVNNFVTSLALQFIKDKNKVALETLINNRSMSINDVRKSFVRSIFDKLIQKKLTLKRLANIYSVIRHAFNTYEFESLCVRVIIKIILTGNYEELLERFLLQITYEISDHIPTDPDTVPNALFSFKKYMIFNFAKINNIEAVRRLLDATSMLTDNDDGLPTTIELAIAGFAKEGHVESVRTFIYELKYPPNFSLYLKRAISGLISCQKTKEANILLREFSQNIEPENFSEYSKAVSSDLAARNNGVTRKQLLRICSQIDLAWLREGTIEESYTTPTRMSAEEKKAMFAEAEKMNNLIQTLGLGYHSARKFNNMRKNIKAKANSFPDSIFSVLSLTLHVWLLQGPTVINEILPLEIIVKINAFLLGLSDNQIIQFNKGYYKAAEKSLPNYSGGRALNLLFPNAFLAKNNSKHKVVKFSEINHIEADITDDELRQSDYGIACIAGPNRY